MNIKIDITTNSNCSVSVQDTGQGYYTGTGFSGANFRYEDTASIILLVLRKSTGDEIKDPKYVIHTTPSEDAQTIAVKEDGYFIINYIVLPMKEWFDNQSQAIKDAAVFSNGLYYLDGMGVKKYLSGNIEDVNLETLVDMEDFDGTSISKLCNPYFSICWLSNCYLKIAKKIFQSAGFHRCFDKNTIDEELKYRRDLVWMTLNVIKYLVEGIPCSYICTEYDYGTIMDGQTIPISRLAEAQRIIERISGCNGLCKEENKSTSGGCGCGCGSYI